MKILCTSDIHGNLTIYNNLKDICNSKKIDLLLLAGDLLPKSNLFSYNDLKSLQENYMDNIDNILKEINCPIFYIFGNDDLTENKFKYATRISNDIVNYNNISFMGFDYVNKTPFNSNREKDEEELYTLFNDVYKRHTNKHPLIILSHCALKDCLDTLLCGERVGSPTLRNIIEYLQPMAYLHGHIHENYGQDKIGNTTVLNCSSYYEIDMLKGFILTIENNEISNIENI